MWTQSQATYLGIPAPPATSGNNLKYITELQWTQWGYHLNNLLGVVMRLNRKT